LLEVCCCIKIVGSVFAVLRLLEACCYIKIVESVLLY
jgi:hypothetical protein